MMQDDFDDEDLVERRSLFWPLLLVLGIATLAAIGIVWKGDAVDTAFAWASGAIASIEGSKPEPAPAASPPGRPIGAWLARCDAAARSCSLSQDLRGVGETRLDASWRIEAQAGAVYAIWVLPTGILVRPGMQLQFDDNKPVNVPLESCAATDCEVRAKMTPAFVETLRTARASVASVSLKGGGSQAFRFSHDGLADGLALLPAPEDATGKD